MDELTLLKSVYTAAFARCHQLSAKRKEAQHLYNESLAAEGTAFVEYEKARRELLAYIGGGSEPIMPPCDCSPASWTYEPVIPMGKCFVQDGKLSLTHAWR